MDIGFMDPIVINEVIVRDNPDETVENIFNFLDKQHSKAGILQVSNVFLISLSLLLNCNRTGRTFFKFPILPLNC